MGSLSKQYSQEKLLGKIYTPNFVVCKILDDIKFNTPKIIGKQVLDPSCGDGQFLLEIARRIISFSKPEELGKNLNCLHGWDIDTEAITQCIANLNSLTKELNIQVAWNISLNNSLLKHKKKDLFSEENEKKFDFIVGNPPYIRIQHLDTSQRQYIQQNYDFCRNGSTDIYIAFYELCLNLLSPSGICGLITPNTFLFTETARVMRQYFVKNKNLLQITNYGDVQLFENATTYSAIAIFSNEKNEKIRYQKALDKDSFDERIFDVLALQGERWQFQITEATSDIRGIRLGDICKIHVGITTLCDRVYVFTIEDCGEDFVLANTKLRGRVKIEKDILRPIVKGSKLKNSEQKIAEYVLFPYFRKNGKHVIFQEEELKMKFPFAYDYLSSVRTELDKRDNGKQNPVAWYAFGRSQGLDTSFGAKIIFSPMNAKPNFIYYSNPDCTFYSGYCIKFGGDIEKLLSQLNSKRMENFVATSSRDFRGGWKAYNKKVIENFEVENS